MNTDASSAGAGSAPAATPGAGLQATSETTQPTAPAANAAWAERDERGSAWGLKLLVAAAVLLGRPLVRLALPFIALYFTLAGADALRASRRYLRRVLGRPPRWRDTYRHVLTFAQVALDRIWLARRKLAGFDLHILERNLLDDHADERGGAVLLGAHIGSFEALHAVGRTHRPHRMAMAMYPDNARMVQRALAAIAPGLLMDIIPIGRPGSALQVRHWLADGGVVGMLADRTLARVPAAGDVAGCAAAGIAWRPFLGVPAPFPLGPLRLAQMLRQRVFFMVGVYRGAARYDVVFAPLADFREAPADAAAREAALHRALDDYVARLEAIVREHPFNWFNFHDFWHEDSPPDVPSDEPARPA